MQFDQELEAGKAQLKEEFAKRLEIEKLALANRFEERTAEAEATFAELDYKREAQAKLMRHQIQKEADANLTRKMDEQAELTKQRLNALRSKMHQTKANDKLTAQIEFKTKHSEKMAMLD